MIYSTNIILIDFIQKCICVPYTCAIFVFKFVDAFMYVEGKGELRKLVQKKKNKMKT